jgi:predicted outer membrane protein
MNWRRIIGSVLAAFMLLANALPAMCGECPKVTAVDACAEKHGAEDHPAGRNTARHIAMDAKCETCADHSQLGSSTVEIEAAALALSRSPLHLAVAAASSHWDAARVHVKQNPASLISNSLPVKPPEHSLVVVLKI